MPNEIGILVVTAASLGFFHTLFGPDHYIPFIMMARARQWTFFKTMWITLLCGLGHVGSSVVMGIIGVIVGVSLNRIEGIESFRGNIAAWLLILFGLGYFGWGIYKAIANKPHTHWHLHSDGSKHRHTHSHLEDHVHRHEEEDSRNITPWILFTIFVFGPCEPLIPLLMYPAAKSSMAGLVLVTGIFCLVTVLTMMGVVFVITKGFNLLPFGKLERYTHAIAGAMVTLSGIGIVFLGL